MDINVKTIMKISQQGVLSSRIETYVVLRQNKLDAAARSYSLKILGPPTSFLPHKYRCLRTAHIFTSQLLTDNKLFSERKTLTDN
jgi:hypothetical protein